MVLFTIQLFSDSIPFLLEERLQTIPLSPSSYSIQVQSLRNQEVIASWRAHQVRTPASVIKLLTTYSSLLSLGYDYRWETKFYYTGRLKGGVLRGNLIIEASGDPTLKSSDLDEIVAQLKRAGIKRVLGKIVIDRSIFKVPNKNSSGFDKNVYSAYNAMPDAMMFNERMSQVSINCKRKGRRARVEKNIPDLSYKVVNKIRLVNGSCRGKRAWPKMTIRNSTMTFTGKISRRCGKRNYCKVITKPYLSFYYALKDKMKKSGISHRVKLKLQKKPKGAKYLFSHFSDRLEDVLSVVAKESNNLYARHLMLTLGAKIYGKPATIYKGREAIEKILRPYYILEEGKIFIDNGCGLSRVSKITAKSLTNLLDNAGKQYGQRWMNTLSIAGVDGTIKKRFQNSIVFNRAWMKTGTIKSVANIAGYVQGASGEMYIVVVLVNDPLSAKYGKKLANSVIEWVAENR